MRRFLGRLGDPERLAVAYEAGPCGYELLRLLTAMGVACDVIAPSLVPVRARDRVKTDRRDAKRLVRLYRAGELSFVCPPSPAHEGLRDLVRARDDLRRARTAARHQVAKQLLRHGRIYREGKKSWTKQHQTWLERQRLDDPLAERALCHLRSHLEALDAQLAAIEHARASRHHRAVVRSRALAVFVPGRRADNRGWPVGRDRRLRRFSNPRELMSYLGLTPSEYSSGDQQHRGHITKCGNRHARRLLVEATWHYQHPPRRSQRAALEPHVPVEVTTRAWQAQVRLNHRHRTLIDHGKRSTVANVAVARELCGFLWGGDDLSAAQGGGPCRVTEPLLGPGGRRRPPGGSLRLLCD